MQARYLLPVQVFVTETIKGRIQLHRCRPLIHPEWVSLSHEVPIDLQKESLMKNFKAADRWIRLEIMCSEAYLICPNKQQKAHALLDALVRHRRC